MILQNYQYALTTQLSQIVLEFFTHSNQQGARSSNLLAKRAPLASNSTFLKKDLHYATHLTVIDQCEEKSFSCISINQKRVLQLKKDLSSLSNQEKKNEKIYIYRYYQDIFSLFPLCCFSSIKPHKLVYLYVTYAFCTSTWVLVLGLYSQILDSKKLIDFYMVEYSLEITLKEKLQTRLARTRKSSFE